MYDSRTKFSHTYDHDQDRVFSNRNATNFVTNDRKISQNYDNYNSNLVQFRAEKSMYESDDSGVCSPPLWKNNPSPPKSPSYPLLVPGNYRSTLSPNSRTQEIVKGQWELMEMVKNMPESCYELSLKDLVEHNKIDPQVEKLANNLHQKEGVKVKRQESNKNMMRNVSFENKGLFLKIVFPFSFKSKKKRDLKVSPKPEGVKNCNEKDLWKKKFTGSSDSDSSRTSGNSSGITESRAGRSSDRSNSDGRKRSSFCWPCFNITRNKKSVD